MATSRVACNSFSIGSNTVISITRDNNSYTHTVTFKFGNYTGTIATKTAETSIVWSPNVTEMYKQIPEAVSRDGSVTCQTYNGNTLIGTSTAKFYAYAVRNDCLPTVTATIEDTYDSTIAVTGSNKKFVNYVSKPKVTVTATAKNSATIKTINIDNVGLVATSSPYTFDTMYDKYFDVTATDSRGYATTTPYEVDFVDYVPCYYNSISLKRTESTSTTAVLTLSGYCFKGNFGVKNNTLKVAYKYKTASGSYGNPINVTIPSDAWEDDGTFTVTTNVTNLSLNEQYTFEILVQDELVSFGNGEETILSKGIGDIRITGYNIQTKNYVVIGDNNNTDWKGLISKRKFGDISYDSLIGSGNVGSDPATSIELKQGQSILGRFDIRKDGYLYNYLSNMSVAEISSFASASADNGVKGSCLLNGGDSNPILIQWGKLSTTPTSANTLSKTQVNFLYQFKGMPMVITDITTIELGTAFATPYDVTETGFVVNLKRPNVVATTILWIAIGNGTNALPE